MKAQTQKAQTQKVQTEQADHNQDHGYGVERTPNHPWIVGENYLIRTVTMILTGRLVAVYPLELVLTDAAWIAETKRYADSIRTCDFKEVEPYPEGREVYVGRGALIDATIIDTLPMVQKP